MRSGPYAPTEAILICLLRTGTEVAGETGREKVGDERRWGMEGEAAVRGKMQCCCTVLCVFFACVHSAEMRF